MVSSWGRRLATCERGLSPTLRRSPALAMPVRRRRARQRRAWCSIVSYSEAAPQAGRTQTRRITVTLSPLSFITWTWQTCHLTHNSIPGKFLIDLISASGLSYKYIGGNLPFHNTLLGAINFVKLFFFSYFGNFHICNKIVLYKILTVSNGNVILSAFSLKKLKFAGQKIIFDFLLQ